MSMPAPDRGGSALGCGLISLGFMLLVVFGVLLLLR